MWQEVSDRRVYVPQRQDVGRVLKLECTPVSSSGAFAGKAVSVESAEVLVAPAPAPPRGSVEVPGPPGSFDPRAPKVTFKVLSYNCLADIYATPQVRGGGSRVPPPPHPGPVRPQPRPPFPQARP